MIINKGIVFKTWRFEQKQACFITSSGFALIYVFFSQQRAESVILNSAFEANCYGEESAEDRFFFV